MRPNDRGDPARPALGLPLGDLLAHDRDHLAAELRGVGEQVVAAGGEDVDAEVPVVQQRRGDRLRGPDEGRRVAPAAGRLRGDGPQRAVEPLPALGDGEQALRPGVLRVGEPVAVGQRLRPALGALLDPRDRRVGLLPRGLLGRPEDGAEGDLDARHRRAPGRAGRRVHRRDLPGGVGERLAPQRVDVRLRPAGRVGGVGGPAERQPDPRLLQRLDVGPEVGEGVVLAGEVPRLVAGPGRLEDLHVLAGAGVALVLGEGVALAALLVVVAAGDDVDGDPAARGVVQRRERLRGERGDRQVRAVGDEQLQPVDVVGDVGGGLRRVRAARGVGGQDAGPAVLGVGGGEAQGVVGVEGATRARVGLRPVVGGGDPEELDGHGRSPVS
jgi:hypothetical protein